MPTFQLSVGRRRLVALALLALVTLVVVWRHASPALRRPARRSRSRPSGRARPLRPPGRREEPRPLIVVDVVGAVRRPGLYRLPRGSRVAAAVARAGGLTRHAERDGGQPRSAARRRRAGRSSRPRGAPRRRAGGRRRGRGALRAVRCRSAPPTAEQLDTLPGVGPVTAQKIVAYRAGARPVHVGRAARRDPRHRPGAARRAARAGRAVTRGRCRRTSSLRSRRPGSRWPSRTPARSRVRRRRRRARARRVALAVVAPRPARLARRRAPRRLRRLVVGQRAARRARPQRAARARRRVGLVRRRRDGRAARRPLRPASLCARPPLRRAAARRACRARAAPRPRAAPGCPHPRARGRPGASRQAGGRRLRRANLAAPAGCPRRPARRRVVADRMAWRRRRRRRPAPRLGPPCLCTEPGRRASRGGRGHRPRRRRWAVARAQERLPGGRACTTCWRSRARTSC